jgi:hypothetical protein
VKEAMRISFPRILGWKGEPEKLTTTQELSDLQINAKDLFFQSFRFSQGSPNLQNEILKWLIIKGKFEGFIIEKKPPAYIKEIPIPMKHKQLDKRKINDEIKLMWGNLYQFNRMKKLPAENDMLTEILYKMLERDLIYQHKERQGRQGFKKNEPDSIKDPHASFVRKYILEGEPTGCATFNELHEELKPLLANYIINSRNSLSDHGFVKYRRITELEGLWEKNHPGQSFYTKGGIVFDRFLARSSL